MAQSETDIVNLALIKLNAATINSLDDPTRSAKIAKGSYESLRDSVMIACPWNFAMKRVQIARDADDLAWSAQSAARYPLPADCLRAWRVEDIDRWNVEGRFLVLGSPTGAANDAFYGSAARTYGSPPNPINLLYIARVEEVRDYPASFVEALAARLAMEWASAIAVSDTAQRQMAALYAEKVAEGRSVDGQEGVPEDFTTDSWSSVRND